MKRANLFKRLLCFVMVVAMMSAYAVPANAADTLTATLEQVDNSAVANPMKEKESLQVLDTAPAYEDNDIVRVSIVLKKDSTLEAGYSTEDISANASAQNYRNKLAKNQATVTRNISAALGEELDVVWNLTLVANIISANVRYGDIETIKNVYGVEDVVLEAQYEVAKTESGSMSPDKAISVGMNGVSSAWASGYTGAGMRIAVIDTGLDIAHQSFDNEAFLYAIEETAAEAGKTVADYDLLDADELAGLMDQLNAYAMTGGALTAAHVNYNEKLPFIFNYIDVNTNVTHLYDAQGEHGSHVTGIAAANRYIPEGDGYVDAIDTVYVAGNAPDAQVIVMKVFGENGAPYDSDYMVAIEDAITLGCDAVNLSLGSSVAGMTTSEKYQELLDSLEATDTVVTISAGNAYAWPEFTDYDLFSRLGGTLYADDVNFHTGGSPGTYENAFTVASVDNKGLVNHYFSINDEAFMYNETSRGEFMPLAYMAMEGPVTLEYVFTEGIGEASDYDGVDLTDKVVFCSRGSINFADKANLAASLGAAVTVIYNNVPGLLTNVGMTGYQYTYRPVISISQEDAAKIMAMSEKQTTEAGVTYYTGTITIADGSDVKPFGQDSDGNTMSEFTSWGVPGDLSLKPEITANGGNIYSVAGAVPGAFGDHASYELMSGTSMAAPQIAGISAQLKQYIEENGLAQDGVTNRALVQSLLMSTAEPLYGQNGKLYPVIVQGAGLANVSNAINASTYVMMDDAATSAAADGKVKAELGDDPDRTGVYSFSFSLNNLTDKSQDYTLDADVFTQDVVVEQDYAINANGPYAVVEEYHLSSEIRELGANVTFAVNGKVVENPAVSADYDFNDDGFVTRADAQLLMDHLILGTELLANQENTDVDGDGDTDTHDVHVLLALVKSQTVTVPADGSLTVNVTIELSADAKAFMDTYLPNGAYVEAYVYADAVADEEGIVTSSHSIPVLAFYGNWSDASMFDKGTALEFIYGGEYRLPYLYAYNGPYGNTFVSEGYVFGGNPVDYESEYLEARNALSPNSVLDGVQYSLIRNAGYIGASVYNTETGEVYAEQAYNGDYAAFFSMANAQWMYTSNGIDLNWSATDAEGNVLPDGTKVTAELVAVPEYYVKNGVVDFEALGEGAYQTINFTIDGTAPYVVGDAAKIAVDGSTLDVTVSDNHYVAAAILYNHDGSVEVDYVILEETAEAARTEISLGNDLAPDVYLLQLVDYAGNIATYRVFVQVEETTEVTGVTINPTSLELIKGASAVITAEALPNTLTDTSVIWSSSDETVATVNDMGVVTAVAKGNAVITATSVLDSTKSATCSVNVISVDVDLNGIVWDEQGEIWFSEINTSELPDYTKMHDTAASQPFVTTAVGADGTLYASTLDTSTGAAALYTIDPVSFEATKLTDLTAPTNDGSAIPIFLSDMAFVPGMFGTGVLLGTYGPYVMIIDPATGECLGAVDQYDADLVGIATCYGSYDPESGEYQDTVYVIQNDGTIIQEIYYGYDGMVVPMMYYFYGTRMAMDSGVDKGSAFYFNSAYYDPSNEMLFWSAFEYGVDDYVTLYAVDEMNDFSVYNLGQFAEGVWPVAGLYQHEFVNNQTVAAEKLAEIRTMIAQKGMPEAKTVEIEAVEFVPRTAKYADPDMTGSVNAVSHHGTLNPNSNIVDDNAEDNLLTVTVTAMGADGQDVDSTNGLVSVDYDPATMTLKSINIAADVSSVKNEDGKVTFGYANLDVIPAGATVATLVFEVAEEAEVEATVNHQQVNNEHIEESEELPHSYESVVTPPTCTEPGYTTHTCTDCGYVYVDSYVDALGHDYVAVVTEPTCTEGGYTTYTCSVCGDSYVADETEALGHKYEDGKCVHCGEADPNCKPGGSADTGDAFSTMWMFVLIMSLAGAAALVLNRKKFLG